MSELEDIWNKRAEGTSPTPSTRAFGQVIQMADQTVSLLLKLGLLLGTLTIVVTVGLFISATVRGGGIVVGDLKVPSEPGGTEIDLTPRILNYLSNAGSAATNLLPLFSELSNPPQIRVQFSGTDFSLDQAIGVLDKVFGNATHVDGQAFKVGPKFGINLRLNGVAIPGGDAESEDLDALVISTADRIIGMTQPILFAQIAVDRSQSLNNDVTVLQNAASQLASFEPFYRESLRAQTKVALSNLQQALGNLPMSVELLRDALQTGGRNSLIESELAARAYFSGDSELALTSAISANAHWDSQSKKVVSPSGLVALRALNDEFVARLTGNFQGAEKAAMEYAGKEASPYASLDESWEAIVHTLKYGRHEEAARRASVLPFRVEARRGGKPLFVEGPAEYNMYLAIASGDWKLAYESAVYADQIHVCQEPTKQYQRAAIHKPWIAFLAEKAKASPIDISDTTFNRPDRCYICLRLEGHSLLARLEELDQAGRENSLDEAEKQFSEAINIAPSQPFAYLERAMLRDWRNAEGADSDLQKSRRKGPNWLPSASYQALKKQPERAHRMVAPQNIANWSLGAAGFASDAPKVSGGKAPRYIDNSKIEKLIADCQTFYK